MNALETSKLAISKVGEGLRFLLHVARSIARGYTLARAYENDFARGLLIRGKGIDLGAKSADAKYYEYMSLSEVTKIDYVDFFAGGDKIIRMDLEQRFPLQDNTYDFVLAFNVLEHVYRFQQVLSEARRILSPGGRLHGFMPLLYHVHLDPNDYFRLTRQGMERSLEDAGFKDIQVTEVVAGPFKAAASHTARLLRWWPLALPLYLLAMGLDSALSRFSSGGRNYCLIYYFSGTK